MSSNVRTRFAPSPTGYLHIGGARTALFNWLFARHFGGTFVLRVEDTDKERNTQAARDAILDGMRWLGLEWDEGPEVGGSYGPYYQSERDEVYDRYFEKLVQAGRVYEDEGAWRFRFERKPVVLHDLVAGDVTIDYRDESNTPDMAIRRADGSYVFHFVNVVDDIEMKISHVIRGEDHVMNTPKHLQLFEALGVEPPIYAHIPLILNPDGSKMSKRDVGAALGTYPAEGFLPDAVVNFLALLGWSPKDDREIFSVQELVDRFSLEAVNRAPAKFDITKCRWLNQQHLMALPRDRFVALAAPYCSAAGLPIRGENFPRIVETVQTKVQTFSEIPGKISFFFDSEYPIDEEARGKVKAGAEAWLAPLADLFEKVEDWNAEAAKACIGELATELKVRAGGIMFPSRVALTGMAGGPDMDEVFAILGKDECVRRLRNVAAAWKK